MYCPICYINLSRTPSGVEFCQHCGAFAKASDLWGYLFCQKQRTAHWSLTADIEMHLIENELRKLVQHSEWSRWRDTPTLHTDPFIQSLFADWCADNDFPLQEQAVRKRLQEAEGRTP